MNDSMKKLPQLQKKLRQQQFYCASLLFSRMVMAGIALFLLCLNIYVWLDAGFHWQRSETRALLFFASLIALLYLCIRIAKEFISSLSQIGSAKIIDENNEGSYERTQSAIEFSKELQEDKEKTGGETFIKKVIAEADQMSADYKLKMPWRKQLDKTVVMAFATVIVITAISILSLENFSIYSKRFFQPFSALPLTQVEDLTNKNVSIAGDALQIQAKVTGVVPEEATLYVHDNINGLYEKGQEIKIEKNKEGVNLVDKKIKPKKDLFYSFRAGDFSTEIKKIKVVHRPRIRDIKLVITPPEYTKQKAKTITHIPKKIRVLYGSDVDLNFKLNDVIKTVSLKNLGKDKKVLLPSAEIIDGKQVSIRFIAKQNLKFEPHMVNEYELSLKNSIHCNFIVYKDQVPKVAIKSVSDIYDYGDRLKIDFHAKDDFAIEEAELVLQSIGKDDELREWVKPIELGKQQGQKNVKSSVAVDLKDLELKDSDRLSYAIRVRDNYKNLSGDNEVDPGDSIAENSNQQNNHSPENQQQSSNSSQQQSDSDIQNQDQQNVAASPNNQNQDSSNNGQQQNSADQQNQNQENVASTPNNQQQNQGQESSNNQQQNSPNQQNQNQENIASSQNSQQQNNQQSQNQQDSNQNNQNQADSSQESNVADNPNNQQQNSQQQSQNQQNSNPNNQNQQNQSQQNNVANNPNSQQQNSQQPQNQQQDSGLNKSDPQNQSQQNSVAENPSNQQQNSNQPSNKSQQQNANNQNQNNQETEVANSQDGQKQDPEELQLNRVFKKDRSTENDQNDVASNPQNSNPNNQQQNSQQSQNQQQNSDQNNQEQQDQSQQNDVADNPNSQQQNSQQAQNQQQNSQQSQNQQQSPNQNQQNQSQQNNVAENQNSQQQNSQQSQSQQQNSQQSQNQQQNNQSQQNQSQQNNVAENQNSQQSQNQQQNSNQNNQNKPQERARVCSKR